MSPAVAGSLVQPIADEDKHPKGLYVLFATEMWERFSFYTMLAMFTLYLRNPDEGFGWSAEAATIDTAPAGSVRRPCAPAPAGSARATSASSEARCITRALRSG